MKERMQINRETKPEAPIDEIPTLSIEDGKNVDCPIKEIGEDISSSPTRSSTLQSYQSAGNCGSFFEIDFSDF